MEFLYIIIILIAVLGIMGIVYLIYYNRLQDKKIKVDEAEYVIDETLRARYDLIIRITDYIKSDIEIKNDYFKELSKLKEINISNFDFDRKLTEMFNLISKLLNDYPELEKNKNIRDCLIDIKKNEEKLEAAKMFYNKYTTYLNSIIKKFPSTIVARMHKFIAKPFFDGKNLDDEIIDDFKI